jgi:hypothetical protein
MPTTPAAWAIGLRPGRPVEEAGEDAEAAVVDGRRRAAQDFLGAAGAAGAVGAEADGAVVEVVGGTGVLEVAAAVVAGGDVVAVESLTGLVGTVVVGVCTSSVVDARSCDDVIDTESSFSFPASDTDDDEAELSLSLSSSFCFFIRFSLSFLSVSALRSTSASASSGNCSPKASSFTRSGGNELGEKMIAGASDGSVGRRDQITQLLAPVE